MNEQDYERLESVVLEGFRQAFEQVRSDPKYPRPQQNESYFQWRQRFLKYLEELYGPDDPSVREYRESIAAMKKAALERPRPIHQYRISARPQAPPPSREAPEPRELLNPALGPSPLDLED